MWILAIDPSCERFYLKAKTADIMYVADEQMCTLQERPLQELKDNGYKIVGECFRFENLQLDNFLLENITKLVPKVKTVWYGDGSTRYKVGDNNVVRIEEIHEQSLVYCDIYFVNSGKLRVFNITDILYYKEGDNTNGI